MSAPHDNAKSPAAVRARLTASWVEAVSVRSGDLLEFFRYFNNTQSPQQTWMAGCWDFSYHILKPAALLRLGPPFEKTALEIGYGSGRLLHAACRYFQQAIGVDIHGNQALVRSLLREQGVSNFELHQTDGLSFPLAAESIDFVYSFIVLQHLATLEALAQNLAEVRRVLKPGGVGVLYFGYLSALRGWRRGYLDLLAQPKLPTQELTLRLTMRTAKRLLATAGLRVIEMRRSHKTPWSTKYGVQFYAVLQPIT